MKSLSGKFLKVGIFLILTALIIIAIILIRESKQLRYTSTYVAHTNEVLYYSQKILSAVTEHTIAERDFMLTGSASYLASLKRLDSSMAGLITKMKTLTANNPSQQLRLQQLQQYLSNDMEASASVNVIRRQQGLPAAAAFLEKHSAPDYLQLAQQTLARIETEENALLAQRKEANQRSVSQLNSLLFLLIAIVLVLVAIIAQNLRLDLLAVKKAEKKRRQTEEELALILTNVRDYAIFTTDTTGNIVSWNDGAERIKGYSKEEITGKNISIFYTPGKISAGELERNLNNARIYGNYETEGWRVKKDGSVFWANNVFTALYDKHYQLKGFAEITRDRTGQQKKQDEISYLSNLVEQITDAIFSTDENYVIKSWNKAAEKLYGFTRDQAIGKALGRLLKSRLTDTQRMQALQELEKNGFYQNESEFSNKDGGTLFVLASVTSIRKEDGTVTGYVGVHKDITGRKKLEEQLLRFNETLETTVRDKTAELTGIFERITDAFVAFDKNWCYTYVNKRAGELFMRSPESLIGKNIWQEFPETTQTTLYEIFTAAYREQQFYSNSDYFEPLNLWLENYVYPSPEGISVFIKNITDKKKAEDTLRQSEARYRKAQAQGKLGHWELDVINNRLFLSDEIYSIYNMHAGSLPNGLETFFGIIHQDDRGAFVKEMDAALSGSKTMDIVHRIVRKDGATQYIHEIADLEKSESGQPLRLTGMAQDITEQKLADEKLRRSEHKYRLLFENNPMPMWMSSIPELNIIDVNESALMQYGYTREEFLRLNARDLRLQEDVDAFMNEVNKINPGATASSMQWRHKKKDGSIIYVEIFNYQIMYEGKPVWLGLSIDITEKTRAEDLLKKSYEDIRELASHLQDIREEERAHIAREIHDELGQQLTGLKMDIAWLSRKKNIEEAARDQKLKEILGFLDGTVNTVRRLSAELRPSILDDLGLVEALEWWSSEFEKRSGIPCSFTPPDDHIEVPSGIAIGLFRIYQESLTNVARHANAINVLAELTCASGQLILKITDNGKGFDTGNTGHKKTLGLLGMKERTLMMGGGYEIISAPGKGTTVIITAPYNNPVNL